MLVGVVALHYQFHSCVVLITDYRRRQPSLTFLKEEFTPISKTLLSPQHTQTAAPSRCEACGNLEEVVSNLQKEIRRLQVFRAYLNPLPTEPNKRPHLLAHHEWRNALAA